MKRAEWIITLYYEPDTVENLAPASDIMAQARSIPSFNIDTQALKK